MSAASPRMPLTFANLLLKTGLARARAEYANTKYDERDKYISVFPLARVSRAEDGWAAG